MFFFKLYSLHIPLSASPTKWSNTLKTIRRQQPTNRLSVFDYFQGLALKGISLSVFVDHLLLTSTKTLVLKS